MQDGPDPWRLASLRWLLAAAAADHAHDHEGLGCLLSDLLSAPYRTALPGVTLDLLTYHLDPLPRPHPLPVLPGDLPDPVANSAGVVLLAALSADPVRPVLLDAVRSGAHDVLRTPGRDARTMAAALVAACTWSSARHAAHRGLDTVSALRSVLLHIARLA